MVDSDYTKRELELMFARLSEKLDNIREDIKETNKHFDVRLGKVERKVETLDESVRAFDTFKSRALAIWSVVIVVVSYFLNRLV